MRIEPQIKPFPGQGHQNWILRSMLVDLRPMLELCQGFIRFRSFLGPRK
jgi:hypothetical protein